MKKIFLSSVAMVGLTAGAMAADLPSRRPPPVPYVAVPVFTWTGFYVGVNAGYGFSNNNNSQTFSGFNAIGPAVTTPVAGFVGPTLGDRSRDGFVGGGQIGYNYQIGSFVLGVEGDVQYTDFGNKRGSGTTFGSAVSNLNIFPTIAGAPGNVAFFNNRSRGSDVLGTVRGRVGYTFDRVLVYATGGLALRNVDDATTPGIAAPFLVPGAGTVITTRKNADDTGYAVGGGIEYAFTPNITAKIEGLYVNFGDNKNNVVGTTNTGAPIVGTGRGNSSDDFAVVRAGINYKFNLF